MTKHGHGLPRKRPNRSAQDEIQAELPELESIDELPLLEPIDELPVLELEPVEDEGPVKASCATSDEPDFDTAVTLHVPEMAKNDVPDAIAAPLARIAGSFADHLRHKRVLVRFAGEALIGSAVKERVADALKPQKPLLVVVRRGFGDEKVHEGRLPSVEVNVERTGNTTNVEVATGDVETQDLPLAMSSHMNALAESAVGGRIVFHFRGSARPDATMRDAMAMALREAGAESVAIGARVLFDRVIEERIKCFVSGNKATITIALTGDDPNTVDALSLVLPVHRPELDGKNVRFQFARESSAVQAFCVDFAKEAGAKLIEVGGSDDTDIVWPPLVRVVTGKEVTLRLEPNGRSRAAVLAAFERECAGHHTATEGRRVVVDWPADFAFDAEAEQVLVSVMNQIAPKHLDCTVGGDHREPFVPEPVRLVVDGDRQVVRIDGTAGKPRELQRAIDRRLPPLLAGMRGQAVRIDIVGDVALSRTLVRSLCTAIAEAGAMRLEVAEGGSIDVLLPPMLAIADSEGGIRITAVAEGRDEAQQQRAVARELEGVELALQSVTIGSSTASETVARAVLEQGASRVVLDGPHPLQIHPPFFESVEKSGRAVRFVIVSTGNAEMDARMLEHELPERLGQIGMLVGVTVTIVWPGADSSASELPALVETLRAKQAAKILLDASPAGEAGSLIQLHPEPRPEPVPQSEPAALARQPVPATGPSASLAASPRPAAEVASAQVASAQVASGQLASGQRLLTLLGRRDESVPPLVMLGVEAGDDPAHLQAVEAELQDHLPRLRGRAVLLIPRHNGADAPVRKPDALVQLLVRVVPAGAAATLIFRGPDAQGRPHFQVLHSSLRALPVGAAFGDPRAPRT